MRLKNMNMVDWTALPADALECIASHITYDADYVRFRAVCTSWRSAAAAAKRLQLPWLVQVHNTFVGLRNFPNPDLYTPHLPEQIRGLHYLCMASPGWIAWERYNVEKHALDSILLHNPFTGVLIPLPIKIDFLDDDPTHPPKECFFMNMYQIVLSSDPTGNDCVILARCFIRWLIRCQPGDSSWTLVLPPDEELFFTDMAYYIGRFYAVSDNNYDHKHRLFVCDTDSGSQLMEIVLPYPFFPEGEEEHENGFGCSLVVSSGDLLLVAGSVNWKRRYKVFRIDLDGGQQRHCKVENLADCALFLGQLGAESFSLSVGKSSCCKRNHIYRIEETCVRAFNMEGGTSVINVLSGKSISNANIVCFLRGMAIKRFS